MDFIYLIKGLEKEFSNHCKFKKISFSKIKNLINIMTAQKILDASSGYSVEFISSDNLITYRLRIEASPVGNIKAFFQDKVRETNGFFLQVSCENWNGAKLYLEAKTNHPEAVFTNTNDVFSKDTLRIFRYQ